MTREPSQSAVVRIVVAGLLSWILPGLGHIFGGDRNRGLIILVTIAVTFWGGIAIGGVRTTVDPHRKKLWFVAQICSGGHALAAYGAGEISRRRLFREHMPELDPQRTDPRHIAQLKNDLLGHDRWNAAEVAVVYTGVAGLLSFLAIMDALTRADPRFRSRQGGESPRSRTGAT